MDGRNRGDDRTFRVSFTSDGVGKLRDTVMEKLKEFLGDYTDDTLVEYVIVLLKNGRRKEEAKNELDVFLGEESDSFISWLWDHLGSNLHLYVQSPGAHPGGVANVKHTIQEPVVEGDSQKLESVSDKERSKKSSKSRRRREWKGLVENGEEHQTLKSTIADIDHIKEDSHRKVGSVKRSEYPQEGPQRKRSRSEEHGPSKRGGVQEAAIAAPRRLLQFAVRDAVAASRPSTLVTEPSLKRLRSVVSTASEDSFNDEHPQSRPLLERVNTLSTAIKAVAEAAKDVKGGRSSRTVFDRLGRAADVSDLSKQLTGFGEDFAGDKHDQRYSEMKEGYSSYRNTIDYKEQYVSDMPLLQRDTEMAFNPVSDIDGYDGMEVRHWESLDVSLNSAFVRNKVEDSLMFPFNVANTADGRVPKARKGQVQPPPVPDTAHKIVKTLANMNTWKSPKYQEVRDAVKLDSFEAGNRSLAVRSNVPLTEAYKESAELGNENVKSDVDVVKEPQKMQSSTPGLYSTGPLTEDADSRTIFLSNVHFAATKDSLSWHFNKFGEVLKVIILTDPTTGLPKGSAYVEFMRKEAAEHALSLDGTSFMSRILKVVKKSSAPPEAASSALAWPRAARPFSYPVSGFGMIPFPRGVRNVYRARPVKSGARSMQWKRDTPSIPAHQMSTPTTFTSAAPPRGLTYVRTDSKANGSSSNV